MPHTGASTARSAISPKTDRVLQCQQWNSLDDASSRNRRARALHGARPHPLPGGPTAARQLADWGADVIKIEAPWTPGPANDPIKARHGPDFQNLHRNKRSLTLNLKEPEGVAIFKRLAAGADVVVENYRPDVKHRLGIDYETLSALNPRLVYASLSGFGQDGPYSMRPGFDQIAQGMGGLMSITGEPGRGRCASASRWPT